MLECLTYGRWLAGADGFDENNKMSGQLNRMKESTIKEWVSKMRGGAAPKRAAVIARIVREVEAQPAEDRDGGANPLSSGRPECSGYMERARMCDSCISECA